MHLGLVAGIFRYPVKSMQGERLTSAALEPEGLAGDRRWGVVDGSSGRVLSAKREARLLAASAALDGDAPVVRLPGDAVVGPGSDGDLALSRWLGRDVMLRPAPGEGGAAYEMNVSAEDPDSPVVDLPCPAGTFLDAAAVHVLTTASLRAGAARHPEGVWSVHRFRPTLLLDVAGDDFAEDEWIGGELAIGGARLSVFAPTVRCVMTTHAQRDLPHDLAIATTVNREHDASLGVYAAVAGSGSVSVGDDVVLARSP